jgi:hypothetical protein
MRTPKESRRPPAWTLRRSGAWNSTGRPRDYSVMNYFFGRALPLRRGAATVTGILMLAAAVGGCGSSHKTASDSASATTSAGGSGAMGGMTMGGGSSSSRSDSGMQMGGSGEDGAMSVAGVKPVPTQVLASTTWEGMKITAKAMTAVPFVVYNGTREKMIKPGPHASFHLMVYLNDAHTGSRSRTRASGRRSAGATTSTTTNASGR